MVADIDRQVSFILKNANILLKKRKKKKKCKFCFDKIKMRISLNYFLYILDCVLILIFMELFQLLQK